MYMPVGATESIITLVSGVSADVFGLLGLLLLFIAIGLGRGKDTLITIIFALYVSALITAHFPFYEYFVFGDPELFSVAFPFVLFVLTLLLCVWIFSNYVDARYQEHTFWRYVEIVALSFTTLGLTGALLYHFLQVEYFYDFTVVLDILFASKTALFIWLVAPIASIPLFVRP